jgi:putative heme-binding domain-containing protein
VVHAGVASQFDRQEPLTDGLFAGPAVDDDTYLRQASALLISARGTPSQLAALLTSSDARQRLAGVLAAGFRLTVPATIGELPSALPLRYESGNAHFTIDYADSRIDLKSLGPVGSFTIAQRWKSLPHTDEEQQMFAALVARLDDADDRVALQAGYFLGLLDDGPTNTRVADARRRVAVRRLSGLPATPIERAWQLGPLDDGAQGFDTAHAPQMKPIDLSAPVVSGARTCEWHVVDGQGAFELQAADTPAASTYLYFRLESFDRQPLLLRASTTRPLKLWQNGRPVDVVDTLAVINVDAGSTDVLLRVALGASPASIALEFRAAGRVAAALPEKLGLATLAERLRDAGDSDGAGLPAALRQVDWETALAAGDAERGRQLFSADALGCAKCHAILLNQAGGGGPSLADARRRFTVSQLVESILLPSKQVAPIFATTSILTDEGRTLAGLAVEENDERLVLLLPTAARVDVPKRGIEARKLQATSPMPHGLVKTPAELGDILAYLLSDAPRAP